MEDLLNGLDVSDDKRLKYIKSLPLCDINIFEQIQNMSKRGVHNIECYGCQFIISRFILNDLAKGTIIKYAYLDLWRNFIDTHLTIPTHRYENSYNEGIEIYLLGVILREYREANIKETSGIIARLITATNLGECEW